jgi:hypothetical protein
MEGAVDRKQLVARVLAKAKKYRNFTRWLGDRETVERITELSEKLQRRARVVATPSEKRIRRRAREIWKENDRPVGRDLEFWLEAEREFRETERLAKETNDV